LPNAYTLTALTASGPIAMVIMGHFTNLAVSLLVTGGICGGLMAVGIRWRELPAARLSAYFGIILWFFFGLAVAGLRIT
jgi:hypothetical protein